MHMKKVPNYASVNIVTHGLRISNSAAFSHTHHRVLCVAQILISAS